MFAQVLFSFQIRFSWPEEEQSDDGALIEKDRKDAKTNDISYMSDQLGLHRVQVRIIIVLFHRKIKVLHY